jgi:hypothetical protein
MRLFLLQFYLLTTVRSLAPDSSSSLHRYMSEALELKMTKRIEKLKFEEKFTYELKHLGLDKNHIIWWGDDDDETNPQKRAKNTTKRDWKEAEFGERLDSERNCWEDKDPLDELTSLKNLEGISKEALTQIIDKVQEKT